MLRQLNFKKLKQNLWLDDELVAETCSRVIPNKNNNLLF
jgi:hypothetical protein